MTGSNPMERSNFFLRTKLLQPRAVLELLERPRLTARLKANLDAPMTMVAADAGCGKTTLIADFVRSQSRRTVWYQLDHTDADPIVFLTYVAQGIRNIAPNFGEAIFPYLADGKEELLRYPERAVDLLINEILESVDQPFILVLDDYHHIGRDTIVHKLVDRLLQYSSDLIHLIITTRDLPPLATARRKTQAAVLTITRDDLLFTDEEVRDLFRNTLGIQLKDDEISEYRQRTHGWITALQLVRQIAEREIHTEGPARTVDMHGLLQQSERDIFDYFAEEVFSRESPETQKLLMHLSLLDSLQLNVCSALFPDFRCAAALPELSQKNVFLTVAGDGNETEEYRFHPLFRDFLRRRLRSEVGQAELAAERGRIAEYFVASRQWDLALPCLIEAQNFDRAAAIVAEIGGEWIASGAFISLGLLAERIPPEFLETHPRVLLHKAEIARLQGEIERSFGLLKRAVKLLHEREDTEGEAESLHSLASLARRRGRNGEAFDLLDESESLISRDSETFLKCANTRGLCLISEGKLTEAEQQFRIALEIAEKLGNEHFTRLVTHNLALAPGLRGDFGEALRWFKRIFRDDRRDKQLPQEAIGHLNVARLHLYRGELEEAEKHLARSLELCQLYDLRFVRPEVFEAYGNFHREKGDHASAAEFYERALQAYDDAEIDVSTKELNDERATFHRMQGDLPRARSFLENLVRARETAGNEIGARAARLRLAQISLDEGKTDGLVEEVKELAAFFHGRHHYYDEALASMLLAEAHFAAGGRKEMLDPLQRALDLSARFDYDYWLRGEIRRNPSLFGEEEIAERLPPDLRQVIRETSSQTSTTAESISPAATVVTASQSITDLTVKVFGHVEIFRDEAKPFAADAWTTRRARDIFCYIATSKHRRVAKDVLIEAFWPGEDPATVEKNFHPTISHIRKALNSKQAFKQNFLLFRDGAYQLNPELSYRIDSEEFERLISEAEMAKREKDQELLRTKLESAHAVCRGEFMAGVYDDWAEERRNFYSEQFSRVLNALAKLSFREGRWAAALNFANEIVRDDPYREDVHRLIMKTYAGQAKPASIKKHFEDLQALMKEDLGIEPAPETRQLYQELIK